MNNAYIGKDIIKYDGSVTILYQGSDNKYHLTRRHNTGDIGLFTFLTYALQGDLVEKLRPKYLDAYFDADCKEPALLQPIVMSKIPNRYLNESTLCNEDSSNIIEYSFVLPASMIIDTENANYLKTLVLRNSLDPSEDISICAKLDIENKQISRAENSNILIYWRLKFSSSSDET